MYDEWMIMACKRIAFRAGIQEPAIPYKDVICIVRCLELGFKVKNSVTYLPIKNIYVAFPYLF